MVSLLQGASQACKAATSMQQTPAFSTGQRPARTPHSGYHFDGSKRRFFEGWYFKVSIPEEKQSFAFMYSAEDPAFTGSINQFEQLLDGPRFPGVGAQVMGADDGYLCQYSQDTGSFWGSRHELELGNTFRAKPGQKSPAAMTTDQDFSARVEQGFQVSPLWHQGYLCDDGGQPDMTTAKTVKWAYSTRPVYGWGDTDKTQRATAGWLAALPVFEPHWQICMAGGLSSGWIEWDGRKFEFENAPSYSEKNWGGSFPKKWFWVQCNVFEGGVGEIALTAGGGRRYLPLTGLYEEVAMVGVHYNGKLYEFVPWYGPVEWEISSWGLWRMKASTPLYEVELEAIARQQGTILKAPTDEAGLAPFCKDTFYGELRLEIWERNPKGDRGKVILSVTSDMAALEVGGGPWYSDWKGRSETDNAISPIVGLPVDVESLFSVAPILKPPGL
ncbi:hypothetical protein GOP47_0011586 [Adiantum capillus-veneris]|uniref:Tocopherol cyclase n=1 Tax=Adiantum capillus-veneris TaxID=13818 RepID=A0A9D4UT24_ADICA|nr:hypothetical protein GOP47_0011586 [Adiantum capillus-veneris]